MAKAVYVCGDTPCPDDAQFEHRFYFGCVPKDFKDPPGKSKSHRQQRGADGFYRWDGGCDAKGMSRGGSKSGHA